MASRLLEMNFNQKIQQISKKRAMYRNFEIKVDRNNCHFVVDNCDGYPPARSLSFISKLTGKRIRTKVRLHILFFYLEKNQVPIRNHSENNNITEMSHICHNSFCLNIDHLSIEPHKINCDRRLCISSFNTQNRDECIGHGTYRPCILAPPPVPHGSCE